MERRGGAALGIGRVEGKPVNIKQMRAQLAKRLKAMEKERDALRDLEGEVSDQHERMAEACDSIREAIERLSEVV